MEEVGRTFAILFFSGIIFSGPLILERIDRRRPGLAPPPHPPPARCASGVWRSVVKIFVGGCIVLPILLLVIGIVWRSV
jgi:hypothetical protein